MATNFYKFIADCAVSEGAPQTDAADVSDRIRVVSHEEWEKIRKSQSPSALYFPKEKQ